MIVFKNKTEHNLSDYDKVRASFSWKNAAQELSGLPEGKGLNITCNANNRNAKSHLKNAVTIRFIHKDLSSSHCKTRTHYWRIGKSFCGFEIRLYSK
jgi:hypothetical protein